MTSTERQRFKKRIPAGIMSPDELEKFLDRMADISEENRERRFALAISTLEWVAAKKQQEESLRARGVIQCKQCGEEVPEAEKWGYGLCKKCFGEMGGQYVIERRR